MASSAWSNPKAAAAHMQAAVVDLESMGCVALEYRRANPAFHMAGSRHATRGVLGYYCAADMNHDGAGSEAERKWFLENGYQLALGHGLSVTCGLYGYVENHSGANLHMHIDDGAWSNVGDKRGVFRTPAAAAPSLPAWPVRAFQKQKGLAADGVVGPLTINALRKACGMGAGPWDASLTRMIQKRVASPVDGVLGFDTYMHMGLAVEKGAL